MTQAQRTPGQPHSPDAERALLGAAIVYPEHVPQMVAVVREADFFLESNRCVWRAIQGLAMDDEPVDPVTVVKRLRSDGALETSGGGAYIAQVTSASSTSANWRHYAAIIRRDWQRREILAVCIAGAQMMRDDTKAGTSEDIDSIVERMVSRITRVHNDSSDRESVMSWSQCVDEMDAQIAETAKRDESDGRKRWTMGHPKIDEVVRVRPGRCVVIGARPGVGKTAVAVQGMGASGHAGVRSLFVTLEMTAGQLSARRLSQMTGIPEATIEDARLDMEQQAARMAWEARERGLPIHVLSPAPYWPTIEREIRAHIAVRGCDVVILDYIQRVEWPEAKDPYGDAAKRLATLGRQCGVSTVILSQLNRGPDNANRAPRMSDLRASGEIEAAADLVILLDRSGIDDAPEDDTTIDLLVPKSRIGRVAGMQAGWRGGMVVP